MYGKKVLLIEKVVSFYNIRRKSNSTKKLLQFLADMPKANSGRIAEAQRQRQNITKKSEKYGSSTVYLQVLGSGARGAPNTLYLFTDQKRYLFNCGEGSQRLAHEHKVKLSKLDHVFITTKTWRNIGGLPGLSLTLQDVGVPNITLHGPEGLDELYNATKRFITMRDMNVTMAKCSPSKDFEDNVMTVKYVLLGLHDSLLVCKDLKPPAKRPKIEDKVDKEFEEFVHDETDYYRRENKAGDDKHSKTKDKPKLKSNAEKDSMTKSEKVLHELQKKSQCSVAYICTLKKRLGTLDLAKCVDMGVPPGPLLGQLKAGHDVVLPDGKLVLSKDVKTPDDPGPVFIVLEVPELLYLKEMEFSEHFDNGQNPPQNIPTLIVHYTPPHVFHHPKYRAFMALFGPTTRHLVLNAQNSCLGSEAVHRTQHKLHLLDPDIFPLLKDASVAAEWNAPPPVAKTNSPIKLKGLEDLKNKIALAQFQNIINMEESCKGDGGPAPPGDEPDKAEAISARTLTTFHLRPRKELDRTAEPKLHIQDYIQETMDMDGFVGSLEHFRQLVEGTRYARGGAKEYPKVVFLGTGSCIPSKTRNTSAIVIQLDENRSMLLDCGEGTFGQLVRFYGPKRVDAFLRTLKAVYISHLHADHHIGLIGVIQARCQAFEQLESGQPPEPLYLLAPGQIVSWLSVYDQQFERIRPDFSLIPNQNLLAESPHHGTDMTSAVLASIGVARVATCLVSHCPNAFGVAIHLDDSHKLTYSGDTIPCEELVKIGQDSTLLIHEATMEDELAEEARIKMHSTTTQAIDIGKQMNAKYTVLTHFSQRYARLPRLNANILNDNKSVGIAFDNMQITMSDLELLPHMYAPLQLMFAEHCVEMELKAAHRARHKERRPSSPGKSGGMSGSRWMSTGCRTDNTLPQRGHSKYRESNASRLRQELKGMTVTGRVQSPRARSNTSPPPSKIPQPITPRSPCSGPCTPSRSRHDRVGSPREPSAAKSLEPIQVCTRRPTLSCKDRDKSPNKITPPPMLYQNQDISPDKLQAKSDTVATRRTISNTSNLSRGLDRAKVIGQHSTSRVVNSHSKTLSCVSRPATGEEVMNIMANNGKSPANTHYETGGSGYGKPLVTPFNKKLTIMRNNKLLKQNVPANQVSPVRSPIRSFRAEHITRDSSPLVAYKVLDGTQKLLNVSSVEIAICVQIHLIFWRVAHISYCVYPSGWLLLYTIIAVGVLFWTANNAPATGNKLRGSITTRNIKPDTKSAMEKPPLAARPPRPTSLTRYDKSPTRLTRSMDYRDIRTSPARTPGRVRSPIMNKTREDPLNMERHPLRDKKPLRKPFAPLPDIVIDRLKQPLCKKNPPTTCFGRPCYEKKTYNHMYSLLYAGIYSNRSYKPQLEDIKSSYLLLNKQSHENVKDEGTIKSVLSPSPKRPKPLDDEQRQHKLKEARQKYQSKGFFSDSKYDKIEGLNWISWK